MKGYRSWNAGGKRGSTHLVNHLRQGEHPTENRCRSWRDHWRLHASGQIIDPFIGSGTTGVAAVKLGRRFIGIEQNERWFDLSCRRIGAALKQPDMFVEPPKPAEQLSMLTKEIA